MKALPKAWYAIAHINEIKSKPLKLERFGKNLVIWQDSGKIVAMKNRCPHRGAELSLGRVCDNAIACPFHGFRFDQHGNCIFNPETQVAIPKLKIKIFPIKVAADMIWINIFDEELDNSFMPLNLLNTYDDDFAGKYLLLTDI